MKTTLRSCVLLAALGLLIPTAAAQDTATVPQEVFVSVLTASGNHIAGLGADDFTVLEDGKPATVIEVGELRATSAEPAAVIVVFDNLSVQKRNRKKVLEQLGQYLSTLATAGHRVLIATTGEELELVEEMTTDPTLILGALDRVKKQKATGDITARFKRQVERDIASAELAATDLQVGSSSNPLSSNFSTESGIQMQSTLFLHQVERARQKDAEAITASLQQLEELLRAVAGVPGRKDLLWIGEGMPIRPGYDLYPRYYNKFSRWRDEINLLRTEEWLAQANLSPLFGFIASRAQYAATTIHMLDVCDRDRQASAADFFGNDIETFTVSDGEISTSGTSAGTDIHSLDGARFLSSATAGSYGRGYSIPDFVEPYYSISFSGSADPKQQKRKIVVNGGPDGCTLRHPGDVITRNPLDDLIDASFAHLRLGIGSNSALLRVQLGAAETDAEGRRIQTVHILAPALRLDLKENGDVHSSQVVFSLQMATSTGFMPAQLVPTTISLPADKVSPGAMTRSAVRIVLADDAERLMVGMRVDSTGSISTCEIPIGS